MNLRGGLLTINAGSSSLKFALFETDNGTLRRRFAGAFSGLGIHPELEINSPKKEALPFPASVNDHEAALEWLLDHLAQREPERPVAAVGHRVVHGGSPFEAPVRTDEAVLQALRELIPLAPLHMPHNLKAIEVLARLRPSLPQVACFDTAFHHSQLAVEQRYAIPRVWHDRGVRRYGFHGLSYEYIASVLPEHLGAAADGKVIVAHLGHGASLCAMHARRSLATTMGFTPLDGIPMATRPGALDPGIPVWLQREGGLSVEALDNLLNHECGLLGISGISADMRTLLASSRPEAEEAVAHFAHHVHRAIASLVAVLGGLDALVFTGGIGEHADAIRARICTPAVWLGVEFDEDANRAQATRISQPESKVTVLRLPTDEERVIAGHTMALLE